MRFVLVLTLTFWGICSAVAQSLPFIDSQFPCFKADLAQKYIRDFKIKTNSFGGIELCSPTSDFKKLLNDLSIIELGRFTNTGQSGFIRGFVASDQYYNWSKMQILRIQREHDNPQAIAVNVRGQVSIQDYYGRLSVLGRVGTLLHEARHTVYHPHTLCLNGPYAELPVNGCDPDFNSGGAHSVEMEYYARVSVQGQNFHPMYKAMARLSAMARANFVFNKSPLGKRDGLLVQTANGSFLLLDQTRWIQRPAITYGQRSVSGRLKRTSFGASLFTGNQAYAIELYEKFDPFDAILDSFSYYKTLINLNAHLADFEEFDIGAKRNVVLITPSQQFASYNFKLGKWNPTQPLGFKPLLTSPYLADGKQGYFLVDSNAVIFAFDATKNSFVKTSLNWDLKAQSIAKANGQIYSLRIDKKIFYLNGNQWTELALPHNTIAEQISSVPLYNAFNILE